MGMIIVLLIGWVFITVAVSLTNEFPMLGAFLLSIGLVYLAYTYLPWSYILPAILVLGISIFWKPTRFLVFGLSAIAVLVSIGYMWCFGGTWVIEFWEMKENTYWLFALIICVIPVWIMIALTCFLLAISGGLASISKAEFD